MDSLPNFDRLVKPRRTATEAAHQAHFGHLASCDSPEPAVTVRQARQKRDELEEVLNDIRAARKLAEDNRKVLESDLSIARGNCKDRVADVVRDDPAVRRLCEKFAEPSRSYIDMRRAVEAQANRR